MSEALATAERAVVGMIAGAFAGPKVVVAPEEIETPAEPVCFGEEFDAGFQTKIAALVLRDTSFVRRVGHLISPLQFENINEAALVKMSQDYYQKYSSAPSSVLVVKELFREAEAKKMFPNGKDEAKATLASLLRFDISGGDYIVDRVATFARHQAVQQAIFGSVDLIHKGKMDEIEKRIKEAVAVGVSEEGEDYDYFDSVEVRTENRHDAAAGKRPLTGITTGVAAFDNRLYHQGWGRKELSVVMGGAKSGKTTMLINMGKAAAFAGHNVLYVTLEVSKDIIAERLDACISETNMRDLLVTPNSVRDKIIAAGAKAGKFKVREFPTGSCKPSMLRSMLDKYKAQGLLFDMLVVDYGDIMAPEHRVNESIENSKSVFIDLRGIAVEYDLAVLTATQTNREGFKSVVAKAEHVAEDFNKVRTCDIIISINITDEERAKGEARLFFAASRNQESGFTIFIKQDIAKMKFIESVVRVE